MPKTWTGTHIHVSDQLHQTIPVSEHNVLCELALDALNNPSDWFRADDRLKGTFLAKDGSTLSLEIGVATIDSSLATIFSVHLHDASLADLAAPLTRVDEFAADHIDLDYQSKSTSPPHRQKIRLGSPGRLQPMKHEPEELDRVVNENASSTGPWLDVALDACEPQKLLLQGDLLEDISVPIFKALIDQ